jgi:hypothetical protein
MILANALAIDGWMSEREVAWLAHMAAQHHRIVELGSWKGRSTRALGDNTPGTVWAVDTWAGSPTLRATACNEAVVLGP